MARIARKFMRVTNFFLAGVTIFCVSWIACVSEWHPGVRWKERREVYSTMRTIIAYSEGKQAEMDRPSPVACDRLPAFPDIPDIDRTWQPGERVSEPASQWWQQVAGTRLSLYSAFYDDRSTQPYVRILASFQGRTFPVEETLYCQTRSLNPEDESVEVVAAKPLEIWLKDWDKISKHVDTPLLLSCPLTEAINVSSVVSIVTEPCNDPNNAFKIEPSQTNGEYGRLLTICVKDMKFTRNISQDLIEWIETNKILGVDKIDIYIDSITKETEEVLRHYRKSGYVRLFHVPIKQNKDRSLWQRRRDHIITYNDCLYRNINESEYIVPLDIDEIVLPKIANTLPELLKRLADKGWDPDKNSGILVQNVFFFDFLQSLNKYEYKNITSKSADRFNITEHLSDMELIDDKDNTSDVSFAVLEKEYKYRCGKELPVPKLVRHVVSSARVSPVGYYSKSLMVTKNVLTAFNHYALNSLKDSKYARWPAPLSEVQLNHYKESCNPLLMPECAQLYLRRARVDRSATRLRRRLVIALASTICTPINDTAL